MPYLKIHEIGEFAVCRDSDTSHFYVYTYDKETKKTFYRSLHTDDLEAAIAAVRSLVERCITGDPKHAIVQKPIRTVTELLDFIRPTVEKQASAEFAKIAIERMKRLMGDTMLQHMVTSSFDRFRDTALEEGIKLSTIDRTLTILRTGCAKAIDERRLPRHHAPTVPYYCTKNHSRAAPPKGRVMEVEEIAAMIDQAQFMHVLVALVWLINLACRIGALLDAVATQIDHRRGLIDLNPAGRVQTSKWRPTLPIPNTLLPWTLQLPPGHLIQWRGQAVGEIDTAFDAACRRAGLAPGGNTYSVRHAAGRYMRSKAVPDEQIALFLGHIQPPQSVATTIIYSPYTPLYLREAKAAVEAFVREIAGHCRKHDVLQPPWING
jgi:integrase